MNNVNTPAALSSVHPNPNPTAVAAAPSAYAPLTPPAHDSTREHDLYAAAQRVLVEVDTVGDDDMEPLNRDVDAVVSTVLGVNRVVQPHLAELAKLPGFDTTRVAKLGDYVDALLYWSASATYAVAPKPELAAMAEQGFATRERTLHDLRALANHGLLPRELLAGFGGSPSHRSLAHDLVGLSNLVHERWSDLGGKTLITLAAMDEAATLGKRIMQALGDRELTQAGTARDVTRRNKAYTLVMRTYTELRDGMAYLRRAQGDVDSLVPSLFARRRGTRRTDPPEAAPGVPTASAAPTTPGVLGPQRSSLLHPESPESATDR